MLTMQDLDPHVPISRQLAEADDRPVVLVNVFSVAAGDVDRFLSAWAEDARFFKAQPGFLSAQLYRGIAGSGTFLNHAVWESLVHFRAAFGRPEFKERLAAYPDCTAAPHLMRPVAVPGSARGRWALTKKLGRVTERAAIL